MRLPDLAGITARIAQAEAQVPHLRPGCEKQILWAGEPETRTDLSVLFVHGFSASPAELRPLPDLVAQGLGANLYFARLTGHGQDGAALGAATLEDWERDIAEALEIAGTIGRDVVIMGCSTGCTLATLALAKGAKARAVIHVSPNFGLTNRLAQGLLDMPRAERWAKYIAGHERRFPAISDDHAAYWTLHYPTQAVHTMAQAVRAAKRAPVETVTTPALFCYNEKDQVVAARETRRIIARWGCDCESYTMTQTPDDDAMGHIMMGDIFSPKQTEPAAQRILDWLNRLPD